MDDDATLVKRAKEGDYAAFETLVSRHEQHAYWTALHILRQREDAEDAVQTAFLQALEHLDGFREEASFRTWLGRIVANASLKALRKRKGLDTVSLDAGTTEREDGLIPHPEYLAVWRGTPEELAENSELRELLDKAIEALPEKHRLVFLLRDIEGLSVAETSNLLGISEANVKVRLLRARLAMRERLTRAFGDEARTMERHRDADADPRGATDAEAILKSYLTR